MSVSVVKEGPYFSSGSISFSQLRSIFKETGSGTLSASQLRRNTNLAEDNPIVPDSTENENISTESNLSLSQFRNSVKRYHATQTGTDTNASYPTEPGFRMGRLDLNGRGIDWSGGGYYGRDGQGGGVLGNLAKNVQKFVYIRGVCGSYYTTMPGAQLSPAPYVYNVRGEVYGEIYGQGGLGGYDPRGYPYGNASGEDGGPALRLEYSTGGSISPLYIAPGARVWAGGGGGEQGQNGDRGSAGTCSRDYSVSSCGSTPSCSSGGSLISTGSGGCCNRNAKGKCTANTIFGTCRISQPSTQPVQGIGGRGGNGRGYAQSRTNGQMGTIGRCPSCPSGLALSGGQCAGNGGNGGDGGDWGSDGGETPGQRTRGRSGAAITGAYYKVYGSINSDTVKGSFNA